MNPRVPRAKIAGNGVTPLFHAKSRELNVSNAMGHTNLNTIRNLAGVTRRMPRSTCQDWKQKKGNHAPTCSSA